MINDSSMDKFYNIIRTIVLLCVLTGTGILSSCMKDDGVVSPGTPTGSTDGFMRIYLDLPDLHTFNPAKAGTRAMNNEAERAIDQDLLNILVFKKNNDDTETFYYKAPITGSITYDSSDGRKAVVTVKLVKSENSSDLFRIVVVANHSVEGVTMVENVTPKQAVLEELTYLASIEWNADETNYTPFPMWGETASPVEIKDNGTLDAIDMYRALARIDVGLNFESVDDVLSENALGLNSFKIKEIKVFRTYDKGFVAPLDATQIYTQPSIPADAVRRADNMPLGYTVSETGGADKYVREIYVPEADLPGSPSKSNMHCIVVGGYYKGSSSISYYRLNFAEIENGGATTYFPILRNHRYTFNIQQITAPGFATAEEALNSDGFATNMSYDVIVWDENIYGIKVEGSQYLGLDNRNVNLAAQATSASPANAVTIKYQTNYPLSDTDTLGLTWKKDSLFKAVWNRNRSDITISANIENVSNSVLSDTLFVRAGKITMPVLVEQEYVNFKYSIDCSSVNVNGTYTAGGILNTSHTIILTLNPEDDSIAGKDYIIETEDVEGDHGISFSAKGTFTSGEPITVTLQGTGTLSSNASTPFNLQINSNSSNGSYCETTIRPVGRKLRVFVLGSQSAYGYNIALQNTGSNRVITSPNNFGPNNNSIVKTAGFELINANLNTTGANSGTGLTDVTNMLDKKQNPVDILYITYNMYSNPTLANVIANYLNNNGVVLLFNEGNGGTASPGVGTVANIMNACFGVSNITQTLQDPGGRLYPLNGDPDNPEDPYFTDPILNGPFGDMRKKLWGEDISHCALISNLPVDSIIVYSTGITINGTLITGGENMVSGFRHKTKNLLYFGDGGFTSYETGTSTYDTACPFKYNTVTMAPIPHPTYGFGTNGNLPVYNSQIWCNAIAWAVERATNHGINSGI